MTLEQIFRSRSRSHVQQLKTTLQLIKKGSQDIYAFIQCVKALALQLGTAGAPVADDDLVLYTTRGLGAEYDPIVAAIDSCLVAANFLEVCRLLFDFDIRLKLTQNDDK